MSMSGKGMGAAENDRIVAIINTKIEEHKIEITGCDEAILKLQKTIKGETTRPDFTKLTQLGILKDKMLFHKSACATLADVLESIK